jgi:hypothetical protein
MQISEKYGDYRAFLQNFRRAFTGPPATHCVLKPLKIKGLMRTAARALFDEL